MMNKPNKKSLRSLTSAILIGSVALITMIPSKARATQPFGHTTLACGSEISVEYTSEELQNNGLLTGSGAASEDAAKLHSDQMLPITCKQLACSRARNNARSKLKRYHDSLYSCAGCPEKDADGQRIFYGADSNCSYDSETNFRNRPIDSDEYDGTDPDTEGICTCTITITPEATASGKSTCANCIESGKCNSGDRNLEPKLEGMCRDVEKKQQREYENQLSILSLFH